MEEGTGEIIIGCILLVVLVFFCLLAIENKPGSTSFVCSRSENICTRTSFNMLNRKSEKIIEFDKIIKSGVEEVFDVKHTTGTKYGKTKYYYYNWFVYYNNDGVTDKFYVFRTSDYDNVPANKEYDRQYRYYEDVTRIFNGFLDDKSKHRIYVPEYETGGIKLSYVAELVMNSIFIAWVLISVVCFICFIDIPDKIRQLIGFFRK